MLQRVGASVRASHVLLLLIATASLVPRHAAGQGMTGSLIGTVKDEQGGTLSGARARIQSPVLIGGPTTLTTSETGGLRFPALPPGLYTLDVELPQFARYREENIRIGAGSTIERTVILSLEVVAQSIVVEGPGTRIEARDPGFATRFRQEDFRTIPTRRSSMFDFLRAAPGISPTSPSSGTVNTVSAFGSATNENTFLIDGTNFTCPCNGVARSEPGVDFIQEIQVQSAGASAEFGNVQGAVINVITRQGGERSLYEVAYYGQMDALTSHPVQVRIPGTAGQQTGYTRAKYRDFVTSAGGPIVRERLWYFAGYQRLRDYDSQPGTNPEFPRKYEQDKLLARLTWRPAPGWKLVQSFHDEFAESPEQPTVARPFGATFLRSASAPAMTFGHLTHTMSANTIWDVRLARFVYTHDDGPSTGDRTIAGRIDSATSISSGAPAAFGGPTTSRTTTKATLSHYRPGLWRADHQLKIGSELERGEQRADLMIPTGKRFVDLNGMPSEVIASDPSLTGGSFVAAAAFVSDAITVGDRVTISAGLRFDHHRAISQDLPALDASGRESSNIVQGLGTLYTWNLWSPRLGLTVKLTPNGRMIGRGTYGRFRQGVLVGEFQSFHPGATPVTTTAYDPATGDYTGPSRVVDPRINLLLDPDMRAPYSDEYSIGIDREMGKHLALAMAYVRKDGKDFIGWTDVGGRYRSDTRTLADGRILPVFVLENRPADRRFLLTNPDGYSLTYNGLVIVAEKRLARGWQAFGSYTFSSARGLQASSGAAAAGAQVSTVAPPPAPAGVTFGRDPNDLTNARGPLPNDRPHVFRVMGSYDVPRSGFVIAGNLQHFSGKPWGATAVVSLPQNGQQRIWLEPRGSRRLSSQSLLDLRVSRAFVIKGSRVEVLLDILNAFNATAEEALITDTLQTELRSNPTFGQPNAFIDPRRAMASVRLSLGH
jgi:hypothetical protein